MKVIQFLLKVLGWKKLLAYVWEAIHPTLKELAEKTEELKIDDDIVKMLDKMIKFITDAD